MKQASTPYHGEDFCLIHGRDHMRSTMGNPIPWCEACEDERREADERADNGRNTGGKNYR